MKFIKFIFLVNIVFASVNLSFQNLEITDFIKMVAKITNKNILITTPIRGKVNFISVKPIKENEVYDILLSILKSKGYTIVKDKDILKIVRSSQAIKEAPPLEEKKNFYEMQTTIITLKNTSARDVYTSINYLVSRYGKIILNRVKNTLIITDYPKNLNLIKKIIKRIDSKKEKDIKIVTLKNSDPKDIISKIKDIANEMFNKKIYSYKIIPNSDINAIILVGDKEVVNKLQTITKQFDKKTEISNTQIITLKNSDVINVEKVLKNIIKIRYKNNPPSITVSKETNSLIIVGNTKQINTLKAIISALDIPKQQVYVKARILEISNSKASQIGAQFGILGGSGTNGLYTFSANLGGPAIAFNVSDLGLALPTLKRGLALGVTLDLLETLGAAKKLSEPSILCINNTPSTIYVGKTISVLTGKTTSTVTSESYSRQDIGLTLKITPRIDNDNKVSLKVNAVIEDILPGSVVGLPTTSKREIDTTTIVNNGQGIIIGGLVRDNKDVTLKKVPLLGDLPFIGALFRHKEINNDKTTLAIVLTPYIIKRSSNLDKLRETLSKLNALEKKFVINFIKKHKKKPKKIEFDLERGFYESN
jgi:general secretion pathway protein D